MRLARLLFVLATTLGCGGGGTRGPTPAKPAAASKSFELTFQTFASAEGGQRGVDQGATLKSGDKIALSVSVSRPAYVYVLQFFADGSAEVLFPGPGEERPINGTQRVPGTGWFQLDNAVGEENVYVVASAEPIAKADAAVMKTVDTVRTTHKAPPDVATGTALTEPAPRDVPEPTQPDPPKLDPLAKPDPANPVKPDAGEPDAGKPTTTGAPPIRGKASGSGRSSPGGISLRERGLTRVQAGSTIRATADDGGVAVFRFSFNHAAK